MSEPKHPNILFIMADQYRHDYLGSAGATFLRTPNLDRLAARGVRFAQCATNSPVCAPARIGLAAGVQPSRLGSVGNDSYLPASVTTYYQRLRDHGYRVGCVGKLDLAKPDAYNGRYGDRPCVYGWGFTHPEECEGKMHAGRGDPPLGPYTHYLKDRGLLKAFTADYDVRRRDWVRRCHDSVLPADAFEDAYIGRRAAEWIDNIPDDFPWHYFVSFVGPHNPFDPPTEYADRYRDAEMPEPIPAAAEGKPKWLARRTYDMTAEEFAVTRRQYCAAIELIDEKVGEILDALERRGQLDDTYILFSADHGEMLGDHGLYTKSVAYEASLRVPLIVAGPGIEGGRVSEALIELIDVNATICELAGLAPQADIDALSFKAVLTGGAAEHRTETVSALRHLRCIRTERYKFIANHNDSDELYDLQADPDERHNLAAEQGEITRRLRQRMSQRFLEGQWRR